MSSAWGSGSAYPPPSSPAYAEPGYARGAGGASPPQQWGGQELGAPLEPAPPGLDSDYRSARGLAVVLVGLLGLMAVMSLVLAGALANRASVVDDVRSGEAGFADVDDAENLLAMTVWPYLVGAVATGIVFLTWQYRHARNAEDLWGHSEGLGRGWAIGGWFIPLANLLLPAIQIFGASRPSDPTLPLRGRRRRGFGSLIVIVWAAFLGTGSILNRIGEAMQPDGTVSSREALGDVVTAGRLMALASLLHVVAAVVGAVMVWQLTTRQDQRDLALRTALAESRRSARHAGVQ